MLRNIIIVGSMEPALSATEVQARAARVVAEGVVRLPGFVEAAATLYQPPIRTEDVPILTDDFAPIDALIPR
jgi:hypothetical protein